MIRPHRFVTSTVLCLLFAAGAPSAHADEAAKRAKIEEMFTVMHMADTIEQMFNPETMRKSVQTMLPGLAGQTPEQKKSLDELMVRVSQFLRETVNWQELEPQYVDLYASTFSETDIDGLLVFYRSPLGQTLIAKQPDITAKSQALAQTRLQQAMPKLMQLIVQFSDQRETQKSKASPAPQP